jgi:3-dehydroquinate dehydratase-1
MNGVFSSYPSICTSIPAFNQEYILEGINSAILQGSAFIEIRFDYMDSKDIPNLSKSLSKYSERCIYTCRKNSEGGKFLGKEAERLKILDRLASMNPAFIDIELSTLQENPELISRFKENKLSTIISWHDYSATPEIHDLKAIYEKAKLLGDIVKLVTQARFFSDNSKILSLYNLVQRKKLISFCMGEIGLISRLLCPVLGSPFTYASLEQEKTAAGQISLKEMREFYDSFKNTN